MLTKVEEIIDPHTGQWDEELIWSVFSPVDVNKILQIPLNVEALDDFVAWHYTRSRTFTVRSAYHVEFDHQFGCHYSSSNCPGSAHLNTIWKELWQLRLPGKIKYFGWKVLKGVLPCHRVLASRHIPLIPQCPFGSDLRTFNTACSHVPGHYRFGPSWVLMMKLIWLCGKTARDQSTQRFWSDFAL